MANSMVSRRIVASGRTALSIKGHWTEEMAIEVGRGGFDYLEIGPGDWGSYEFLEPVNEKISHVKIVGIREATRGLERLAELRGLGLSLDATSANVPNLTAFPKLESFSGYWNRRYAQELPSLSELETVAIFGFGEKDCGIFGGLAQLRSLSLTKGVVESLGGLESLKCLEGLELVETKKLVDISALTAVRGLKRLWVENSPNIGDLNIVSVLTALEELYLFKCGTLEDLSWVQSLANIRKLWVSVPVKDLDWCCVLSPPELKMLTVWPPVAQAIGEVQMKDVCAKNGKIVTKFNVGGTKKAPIYMLEFN